MTYEFGQGARQTGRLAALPDRALFVDQLAGALLEARPVTVLFLNIDGIGAANDRYGYALGDQLVTSIAQRLSGALPSPAMLARFGGDELLVLDPSATNNREATQLAERLIERLRQPLVVEGIELSVGVSVGIAVSSPALARPDDLLRAAGIALRDAKRGAPGGFCLHSADLSRQRADRLALEGDLRRALDRGELSVYYQPQVDLASGLIAGVEALVRWRHPRRGLLSAGSFVPIAEETRLIVPIGSWVLDEACRQAAEWRTQFLAARRLTIAVNFSEAQVDRPDFAELVAAASAKHGIPLNRLEVELPGSRAPLAAEALRMLRRRKLSVAIDHFGSDFGGLRRLRESPVDRVKIDRGFLLGIESDPRLQQLLEVMIDLAGVLGAQVTAEGVETAEQIAFLRAYHVDRAQGYSFSPPLSAGDLGELLRADRPYPIPDAAPIGRASRRARRRSGVTSSLD